MQTRSAAVLSDQGKASVLRALIYFDLFDHPLREAELRRFAHWEQPQLLAVLQQQGYISYREGYYCLAGRDGLEMSRRQEQERVQQFRGKARVMARLIASFPFVRGLGLSGSLSKQRMDVNGDLDFFVITRPGRLWVARTLLMLFKKVFLLNSHKYFCLNYFVDENNLLMLEQNRYIATEIASLIPLYNEALYEKLLRENAWVERFLGPLPPQDTSLLIKSRPRPLKKALEKLLELFGGDRLDHFLCWQTWRYRRRKFATMPYADFKEAFDTSRERSRHHPRNFNARVEAEFRQACAHFEEKWGITLKDENA